MSIRLIMVWHVIKPYTCNVLVGWWGKMLILGDMPTFLVRAPFLGELPTGALSWCGGCWC